MTAPYPVVQPGWGQPPAPRTVNPVGTVIALLGGALALVGAFVDWYRDVQLGDIVNALDVDGAKSFPKAYFIWLMWALLAGTVLASLFACVPIPSANTLRVMSPVLGVLGAVLVVVALNQLIERGSILDHSAAGLYLTMIGFVAAGVGGVLGPRRSRPF